MSILFSEESMGMLVVVCDEGEDALSEAVLADRIRELGERASERGLSSEEAMTLGGYRGILEWRRKAARVRGTTTLELKADSARRVTDIPLDKTSRRSFRMGGGGEL